MKGLESLAGHAQRQSQSACARYRTSREVPAMSRVEALAYVTAKRTASRDHLDFDQEWVRTVSGCDPRDKQRTQAEANPETKRCYQEVLPW